MSLARLYENLANPTIGAPCTVAVVMANLDPADRTFLVELLASDESHAAISRLLKANDTPVGDSVIGRHRRGECKCDAVSG